MCGEKVHGLVFLMKPTVAPSKPLAVFNIFPQQGSFQGAVAQVVISKVPLIKQYNHIIDTNSKLKPTHQSLPIWLAPCNFTFTELLFSSKSHKIKKNDPLKKNFPV